MEVRDCVDAALTLALSLDREAGKAGRGKTRLADSLVSLRSTGRVESRLLQGHGCSRRHGRAPGARPLVRNRGRRLKGVVEVKGVSALQWGMKLAAQKLSPEASCAVAEL